jgi:hypothetical protein
MFRYVLALCAAALVAAACSSSASTTTTSLPPATTSDTTTGTTSDPTSETTVGSGVPEIDPGVVDELRTEVEELADIAAEIRGLPFIDPPNVVFLTEGELAARVRAEFEAELEPGEVEWTEALLDLLGLLDPQEQPLMDLYLDLLSEQVLGLYVSDTKELLVRADLEDLSVLSKTTVLHELIHALTDQHFDAGERVDDLVAGDRFDEASAYLSLLEGEATYFQFVYIADYLSAADAVALATEVAGADSSTLEETPYAIAETLFFRYEAGFDFALTLAQEEGVEGFNDANREPPTTTEQIAHPDRFFDAEPGLAVTLAPVAVAGYEVVEESTWGELQLLATFGQAIGEGAADQIADGWGGDAYRIMTSGPEVLFLLSYRADSERDATEVAEAFVTLATSSMDAGEEPVIGEDSSVTFSGEDFAFIDRSGDSVVFVAASDPAAGIAAAAALDLP